MALYVYTADSDTYEGIEPKRVGDRDTLWLTDGKRRGSSWKAVPVVVNCCDGNPGDFPSLYIGTPVFSKRAWLALQPLIGDSVEALPILYPDSTTYYTMNVLEIVDCLDVANSEISRNGVTGNVSWIHRFSFKRDKLRGKHLFKIPEAPSLFVFVSDDFKRIVEEHNLRGLKFKSVG